MLVRPAARSGRPGDLRHRMEWIADLLSWLRTLHSDEGVRALIAWGGLSVLVAIVFAETGLLAGFFLPGDSLLVTAGVVCAGAFPGLPPINIWVANLLLVLAAVIGDQVGYGLGMRAGRAIYNRPDTRACSTTSCCRHAINAKFSRSWRAKFSRL